MKYRKTCVLLDVKNGLPPWCLLIHLISFIRHWNSSKSYRIADKSKSVPRLALKFYLMQPNHINLDIHLISTKLYAGLKAYTRRYVHTIDN